MKLADLTGPDAPATVTVEQTAEVLHIGRGTAYEAARQGQLPTLRLGRRLLVPVASLLTMLGHQEPSMPRRVGPGLPPAPTAVEDAADL